MRLKKVLFSLGMLLCATIHAQTPILTSDFNEGNQPSIDRFNNTAIELNGEIILPVTSDEFGSEVGIITDGRLEILIDLLEGEESSMAQEFTALGDYVYFAARDARSRAAGLFRTDGTAEGTELVFRPTESRSQLPRGLIASKSDKIYFNHNNELYSFSDEDGVRFIADNVGLFVSFNQQERNYTRYRDEIAFVRQESGRSHFDLATVRDNALTILGRVNLNFSNADIYALSEVKEGLVFSVDDSDGDSNYLFQEQDSVILEYDIAGNDNLISRKIQLSDSTILTWLRTKGVFHVDGNIVKDSLIYSSMPNTITSGEGWNHLVMDSLVLFEGGANSQSIISSDGSRVGTREVGITENPFISNMISGGRYVYFADGISNRFNATFYRIDLETNQWDAFYTVPRESFAIESIIMLGIQNNRLYFGGDIETGVGREVYYFELDNIVATENPDVAKSYELFQDNDVIDIRADISTPIELNIFDVNGRLLQAVSTDTNTPITLNNTAQMLLIHVYGELGRAVYKIARP